MFVPVHSHYNLKCHRHWWDYKLNEHIANLICFQLRSSGVFHVMAPLISCIWFWEKLVNFSEEKRGLWQRSCELHTWLLLPGGGCFVLLLFQRYSLLLLWIYWGSKERNSLLLIYKSGWMFEQVGVIFVVFFSFNDLFFNIKLSMFKMLNYIEDDNHLSRSNLQALKAYLCLCAVFSVVFQMIRIISNTCYQKYFLHMFLINT